MNRLSECLAAVEGPVLERGDDLDWSSLPRNPADLNFLPEVTNTAATRWLPMMTVVVTSFLSLFGLSVLLLYSSFLMQSAQQENAGRSPCPPTYELGYFYLNQINGTSQNSGIGDSGDSGTFFGGRG